MPSNESDWEKAVFIAGIVLLVIFFFKILFWVGIGLIVVGIIWIILDRESDYVYIPAIMIIVGLILTPISYYIGYQFENTELGKPIVDASKAIVEADEKINQIPQQISDSMNEASIAGIS